MHYYAAVLKDGSGEFLTVHRYNSKAERDEDCKPYNFVNNWHKVPVTSSEGMRLARKVCGLRPYERFYGEINWTLARPWFSVYGVAFEPEIITH